MSEMSFVPVYTDADIAMVERINAYLQDSKTTGAELSRATSIKEGTRSSILNGSYISSPTKFLVRMSAEIDRQLDRADAAKNDIPYSETSVAKKIVEVCQRAHVDRDFGVFFGKVGIGKTRALRHYASTNQAAILLEAFEGIDHSTFIQEMVEACGAVRVGGTISQQMTGIIRTLKSSDRVILVDEANWLPPRSFGALRRISDIAEIGVVLVGTKELLPMLHDPDGRFGQISSRIGYWPPLFSAITDDDCALLVDRYFGQAMPPAVIDTFYRCCEGSGRSLQKILRNTYRYLQKNPKEDISPDLINAINSRTMAGRGFTVKGGA